MGFDDVISNAANHFPHQRGSQIYKNGKWGFGDRGAKDSILDFCVVFQKKNRLLQISLNMMTKLMTF